MIAKAVYFLCFLTSLSCALLLLRAYRRDAIRFLLWSGICFIGLALNNLLTFVDLVILNKEVDLSDVRPVPTLLGLMVLIYGLVWDVT